MIGNPKWFALRKYTGWGLTPITWQGWSYITFFIIPIVIVSSITIDLNVRNIFTTIWIGLFLVDIVHIMSQIQKDERERLHEAIADRNALWFMIFILIISVFIRQVIDPIFVIALVGATLIKAGTQFYLRDK